MKNSRTEKQPSPSSSSPSPWFVYLLECINGRLYTGITTDLNARLARHKSGKGAMFTRLNAPSHIIAAYTCANRSEASILEAQVKRLTPTQKRDLAASWLKINEKAN
jgi:putative endonuclease